MSEHTKAIAQRFFDEVVSQGNLAVIDELFAADYQFHLAGNPQAMDREGVKQFLVMFRGAFPDLQDSVEDLFGEGDRLVIRGLTRGTHRGAFMEIPASGKPIAVSWIDIMRFTPEGKMAEAWLNFDMLSLLQQLGAIPAAEAATT